MRIKLEKKAEEYKPVKGNELEIIKHLLDQLRRKKIHYKENSFLKK